MTFRVYVRWPAQRVTDKTTTDNQAVAEFAFEQLLKGAERLTSEGALGITLGQDGKQLKYQRLADDPEDGRTGRR